MRRQFYIPGHRELTPEEEEKLFHIEEQMKKADEKSPVLMKQHLETLNDGVIAIIITIMVLELPFPGAETGYTQFLSAIGLFLVSFFIVADFWYDHHRIFESVRAADHTIVILNFLFLAALSLIPVMTKWILAERSSWSVAAYGTVFLTVCIIEGCLQFAAVRERFGEFRELYLYMFARSQFTVIAVNLILLVLGWSYPEIIMPCYLILPLISFLQPRRRGIHGNSGVLRSVTFRRDEEAGDFREDE